MTIEFLYPSQQQKDILDELEKINKALSQEPSPQLKKNMRFVKRFTYALLRVQKPQQKEISKPYTETKPIITEIKHFEEPKKLFPPPPPPPSISVEKIPSLPIYTKLKKENNILKYESLEPEMQQQDWKIFSKVKSIIKQQILENPNVLEDENFISQEIQKIAKELKIKISPDYTKKIKYYLIKNIKGYGKIDPLINDDKIKTIICNSYDIISVIYNNENLQTDIRFDTNEEMNDFILNLAERFDKKISEETPQLEFSTDKFKIFLVYNPLMGRSSFRINKL